MEGIKGMSYIAAVKTKMQVALDPFSWHEQEQGFQCLSEILKCKDSRGERFQWQDTRDILVISHDGMVVRD